MNEPYEIPLPVWEDLVQDFLEIACLLTEGEQKFLIEELQQEGVETDYLQVYPSFNVDNRLVVISEAPQALECWVYYPKDKKLIKRRLEEKP